MNGAVAMVAHFSTCLQCLAGIRGLISGLISGNAFGLLDFFSPVGPLVIRTSNKGKSVGDSYYRKVLEASPVLAVQATGDDSRSGWMNAGQALARVLPLVLRFGYGPDSRPSAPKPVKEVIN
jgi:hypothetical protein